VELVVDANVLVAAFLRAGTTRELLLDERLTLWAPEHSLTEAERVLTARRLRRKLGELLPADVRLVLTESSGHVRFTSATVYQSQMDQAERLAPHLHDAPYLALALHLRAPLWSNDAGLKHQSVVPVYTTQELLGLL